MKNRKINFDEIGGWSFFHLYEIAVRHFRPSLEHVSCVDIAIKHFKIDVGRIIILIKLYDLEVGYTDAQFSIVNKY